MVAATLASAHTAQARCGETLEEVKARYGEPIAILDKKCCEESDNGTYVFLVNVKKNVGTRLLNVPGFDVRLVVEFKNHKAWLIRYTSQNLTEAYRQQLLDINGGQCPVERSGQHQRSKTHPLAGH